MPTVRVTFNRDQNLVECDPEWVHCYWKKPGEGDIRWRFEGFGEEVKYVGVNFLPFVPAKLDPPKGKGFLPGSPFLGVGPVSNSGTTGLPDLQTYGNLRQQGYFCYALVFYDENMKQLYVLDPGGTNDPDPPNP